MNFGNDESITYRVFKYGGPTCFDVELPHQKLLVPVGYLRIKDIRDKLTKLDGLCRLRDKTEGSERYLKHCVFDTGHEESPLVLLDKSYLEHFEIIYGGFIHTELSRDDYGKLRNIGGKLIEETRKDFQFKLGTIEFESKIGFVRNWLRAFRQRIYFGMNVFCQMISTVEPTHRGVHFHLKKCELDKIENHI